MSNQIDFNDLTYQFKDTNINPINFVNFNGLMYIYNNIKNGNVSVEKIEEDQKQFKSKLNEITTGNPRHESKDQLDTIQNIKNIFNSREKVIKIYNDLKPCTKQGTGLKILTQKQRL